LGGGLGAGGLSRKPGGLSKAGLASLGGSNSNKNEDDKNPMGLYGESKPQENPSINKFGGGGLGKFSGGGLGGGYGRHGGI